MNSFLLGKPFFNSKYFQRNIIKNKLKTLFSAPGITADLETNKHSRFHQNNSQIDSPFRELKERIWGPFESASFGVRNSGYSVIRYWANAIRWDHFSDGFREDGLRRRLRESYAGSTLTEEDELEEDEEDELDEEEELEEELYLRR